MSRRAILRRKSIRDLLREEEGGGEFFERDPETGQKTDVKMHAELLGDDEPGVYIEPRPAPRGPR